MPPLEPVDERLQLAMQRVLLATLPGMLALFWLYGWGVLINLVLAAVGALAAEAAVLKLRKRSLKPSLSDGSALVIETGSGKPCRSVATAIVVACCRERRTPTLANVRERLFRSPDRDPGRMRRMPGAGRGVARGRRGSRPLFRARG